MLAHLTVALVMNAWAAFSPAAAAIGLGGLGLVVLAFLLPVLPGWLRAAIVVLGLVLAAAAAIYQAGTAKGAHDAFVVAADRARAAETIRADLAEAGTREIGAQATLDAEAHAQTVTSLRKLTDDLAKRSDRDRIALPHDLARGLRLFRNSAR